MLLVLGIGIVPVHMLASLIYAIYDSIVNNTRYDSWYDRLCIAVAIVGVVLFSGLIIALICESFH